MEKNTITDKTKKKRTKQDPIQIIKQFNIKLIK